jgi:hypothetical protein
MVTSEGAVTMNQVEQRTAVAVEEVSPRADEQLVEESPLYGVAMLKIAMELKKPGAKELDDILAGVLSRMRIPEEEFRRFLSQNGGMLKAIAQKRQY